MSEKRFDDIVQWQEQQRGMPEHQETYQPQWAPTRHSNGSVPFLQATISGGFVAGIVLAICFLFRPKWPADTWIGIGLFIFLVASGLFWARRLSWVDRTMWSIERATNVDINQDGAVGEPAHPMTVNRARTASTAEQTQRRFEEFVDACYTHGTDVRSLKGAGFDDREIVTFRGWMLRPDIGLGRPKGDSLSTAGWERTVTYEEAKKILAGIQWVGGQGQAKAE